MMTMRNIAWSGPGPSRALADHLRSHEIAVDREDRTGLPLVVATADAQRVPAPRAIRGRWIWVSSKTVAPARAIHSAVTIRRPCQLLHMRPVRRKTP